MNILFVRITNRISGAEKYNYYLAQELVKYSAIKPVFLTDCEEFGNHLEKLGLPAHILPIKIKEIGTKKDLLAFVIRIPQYFFIYLRVINRLHRVYKFKLICFESMTEKIFLTPLFQLLSYKVVWIEHGPLFKTERAWLIKKMYRLVSKLSNEIIAVSRDTENDLIGGGISREKVSTIYIGMDIKDYCKGIQTIKEIVPKKMNIIGFVGTLNEEKGIMRFMHIAEMLIAKDPNMFFLIVGSGPKRLQIISFIKQRGFESKFLLTGFVDNVSSYLQQMNIVIFPTKHHEGLSLAILEALAIGKLVFAYDIGGNSELILHNKTGYLFKEINDKFIDLILNTLKDGSDQKRIKHNAIAHINKYFDQRKQTLAFETLFNTL